MERGEWQSRTVFDYIDADKIDHAVFLHTTMERSDEEDEADEEELRKRQQKLVTLRHLRAVRDRDRITLRNMHAVRLAAR